MADKDSKNWKKFREENEQKVEEILDEELIEDSGESTAVEHPKYKVLEEKLILSEKKAQENWEKAVRAMAELDNGRRRAEQDVAKAHRYGQEKIITSLLPVVDSLEQALQIADTETQASMVEGLELTLKLFLDALAKQDVQQIDPQGEQFDPQEHEAMSMLDIPNAAPNSIITVFQKGYKLNDRIIRPARVIVARGKASD